MISSFWFPTKSFQCKCEIIKSRHLQGTLHAYTRSDSKSSKSSSSSTLINLFYKVLVTFLFATRKTKNYQLEHGQKASMQGWNWRLVFFGWHLNQKRILDRLISCCFSNFILFYFFWSWEFPIFIHTLTHQPCL